MATPTIENLCQQARQAIAQRDWEKARQAYLQALGLESHSADVHQGLATVCFQLRDLESAAYHFKEVTRLDPYRAGAFINLGAVYNLLDRLDDAIVALRRGIQLDPHRAEGYYNLGLAYRRKGQIDLAIQAYREAVRVNPRMADSHYNLGNLYLEKEMYRQAVLAYKEALAIRPDWDKALHGLAQAEAGLAESEAVAEPTPAAAAQTPTAAAPSLPTPNIDPHKMVDPTIHGVLLTSLHKVTIDSEDLGKRFLEVVEDMVGPAIKDLSTSLLYTAGSVSSLDSSIQKFEQALAEMKRVQHELNVAIEKMKTLGNKLVNS
jgi:Flp pilus assembly protein TadD